MLVVLDGVYCIQKWLYPMRFIPKNHHHESRKAKIPKAQN